MMKNFVIVLLVGLAAVCRAGYVDEVMADAPEACSRFDGQRGRPLEDPVKHKIPLRSAD